MRKKHVYFLLNVIFVANLILKMASLELTVECEYDFSLYGIVCSLKEYQIAYYLNKLVSIDLEKSEDLKINYVKGGALSFSIFTAQTESSDIRLIKNKAVEIVKVKKPFIVPEKKEFDFFFQVEGMLHDWNEDELEDLFKRMDQIQYVKQLEVENIDSKENLIYLE